MGPFLIPPPLGKPHSVFGGVSSIQGRSTTAALLYACLFQAIDGVMSLILYQQVVSQFPQHLGSSETQTTWHGCFVGQSVCSVISLDSSMSRTVDPQESLSASLSARSFPLAPACPGQ